MSAMRAERNRQLDDSPLPDERGRHEDAAEIAELTSGGAFRFALGPFSAHTLHVLRVRGREALSRPYAWTVTFVDPRARGHGGRRHRTVRAAHPRRRSPRHRGRCFGRVEQIGACTTDEHGRQAFRARLVPQLARLGRRRTSRVFESRTVPEIVSAVLDLSGVAHRFETRASYTPRAYCVQYDETDLAFVRRICAEAGLWFRFDAPSRPDALRAEEIVTFGDESPAPDMEGGARLLLRPSRGSALQGDDLHVTSFDQRRAVMPRAITVRGHDFRRPEAPLEARARRVGSARGGRTTLAPLRTLASSRLSTSARR